jgi:PAS domain S-box-containing protein
VASTLETHGDKPLAPPHDPRDSSRPLLRDQVDLLYAQAGTASAFTLANGAILVGVLWDVAAHGPLLAWAALLAGVTGLRYALSRRYRTRPLRKEPELWRDRFVIGAALGGLCWGIVGSWLLPMSSPGHQTLSLIMVAGMSAGALSYQVAVPRAYILYASGALLPTALWLLISGQPVLPVIGVLALILWASLLLTARAIHRTLLESLRLRYVNADLIEDLAESQRQLRSANRRLQGEIAEHTRTEAELRDSFLFLKRIQDNTTNAIYVLDREGHFVHVNHVTSALTAYPRDSLVGRPFLQLFDAETADSVSGQLARALRGETVTQFEAVLTRAEGGIRNVSFNLAPLHEGTQVSAVVGTAEDVTERKRMDRLKSEFLSTVSHELRTPLTSIRGSLGLLHNAPTGIGAEDTQALVGIAYKNTDRLIRLINDLLDIQKL